jgi:3-deoxy-D-manno-octulosonic-acid transferase
LKRKAIFLLYRVLQTLASPLLLVYLLLRGLRNPRYFSTLRQRLGETPPSWQQTVSASIWLHAVSVGEIVAAVPLIEGIRQRSPATPIFVSTTTLAGRETAEKRLSRLVDGVFFAPLDYVWMVRRVLRRLRPSVVVILETEIWPNLFRESERIGCGLMIVNARISDRALPSYRRFAPLFSVVLGLCDTILAQSDEMKARFEQAGALPDKVLVGGNLKYDWTPSALASDSPVRAFIDAAKDRPLWIAASTSADDRIAEEDAVIAAQRQLQTQAWRLIIAPRKPERFGAVADLLQQSGLNWTRRGMLENPQADVLLLDSIGELGGLFSCATVVFMGGTLADRGGHNILEPAFLGKPVIVGPHMENFREIDEHFERHQAIWRIDSGDRLAEAVLAASSQVSAPGLGDRARAAAEQKRGAATRAADAVLALYDSVYPCERRPQPAHALLLLFALLWRAGSALDRRFKKKRAHRLPVPVVSVGNITAGGTGKTPVVIELLRGFRDSRPGLLTRGHGRTARENVLFLESKASLPRSLTGDEAQLCMRAAQVPIGIGPDRYAVGEELLLSADLDLLFLDDGFQHLQLRRDFDLVLIDALRPFGGGELVPLGRLREPLSGLSRASAFVITRSNEAPNTKAIESVVRRYNSAAPVFRARTVPAQWRDAAGGRFEPGQFQNLFKDTRAVAFCGLGNPQAFWKTLRRLGIEPVACYEYDDHHQYTPAEIRRLAQHARDVGAKALLTTAKDAVNLDANYPAIIGGIKLYWLEIRTEIDSHEELLSLIRIKVRHSQSPKLEKP